MSELMSGDDCMDEPLMLQIQKEGNEENAADRRDKWFRVNRALVPPWKMSQRGSSPADVIHNVDDNEVKRAGERKKKIS